MEFCTKLPPSVCYWSPALDVQLPAGGAQVPRLCPGVSSLSPCQVALYVISCQYFKGKL